MIGIDRPLVHGRSSTYTNYGCRCDPCREANHEYNRGLRRRSKEAVKWVRENRPDVWESICFDVGAPQSPRRRGVA